MARKGGKNGQKWRANGHFCVDGIKKNIFIMEV